MARERSASGPGSGKGLPPPRIPRELGKEHLQRRVHRVEAEAVAIGGVPGAVSVVMVVVQAALAGLTLRALEAAAVEAVVARVAPAPPEAAAEVAVVED